MSWLPETLLSLFDRGGPLLWVILATSTLMWGLILERIDFLLWRWPRWVQGVRSRLGKAPPRVREIRRQAVIAQAEALLSRHLGPIHSLTQALPLLGLLGTVSGMIEVFQALTVFGTGNARAMAGGISQALITTLAGLVTALSGLYLASQLEQRARDAVGRLSLELSRED